MTYSKLTTLLKAFVIFAGALGSAVTAILLVLPSDAPEGTALDIRVLLFPAIWAGWRGVENYRKNAGEGGEPLWEWKQVLPFLSVVLLMLCTACAFGRFDNTYIRPDGTTSKTSYRTSATAWPFGKLDNSAAKMKTQFGGGTMETGLDTSGWDNTNQAAVIDALIRAWPTTPAPTIP
jgi:hypothetical protein